MVYHPADDQYPDQIHNMTYQPYREMVDQLDAKLLQFFGTYENAQRIAHLYVLESYPVEMKTEPTADNLSFQVTVETHYRIRLKTKEELEAEQTTTDE